jgi:hypothetical protein
VTLAGKESRGRAIGAQAPTRLPIELAEAGSNLFLVAGNSSRGRAPSVMIEKFAITSGKGSSEFLDHHTSKSMLLVSLLIPKFAPGPSSERWRTAESGH